MSNNFKKPKEYILYLNKEISFNREDILIFNYILFRFQKNKKRFLFFSIIDIKTKLGLMNSSRVKQSLFNILNFKIRKKLIFSNKSYISNDEIYIGLKYTDYHKITEPKQYAIFSLEIEKKLKNKYSIFMYELFSLYKNRKNNFFNISIYNCFKYLSIPSDKYLRFSNFKKKIIDKFIKDISDVDKSFDIEYSYLKEGRGGKVTLLKFLVLKNNFKDKSFKSFENEINSLLKLNNIELKYADYLFIFNNEFKNKQIINFEKVFRTWINTKILFFSKADEDNVFESFF